MNREEFEREIEEARKELVRLSPIYKDAEKILLEISAEITKWSNRKHNAELKLVNIKKVPAYECPVKRSMKKNTSFAQLMSAIANASSKDKEVILRKLQIV